MRAMVTQFFLKSPLLVFPVVGLLMFAAVFAVVLVRTLGKRGRGLQALGALPLEAEGSKEVEPS